jgi:methionyl-tRNA formyltransferase
MALRVVFMGTPDFSVPTLAEIVGQGHDVVAVYTRAPAPAGRGMELRKSPVHLAAERFGIPVRSPKNFRDAADVEVLSALAPDLIVVVAYGVILPQSVLDLPPLGCVNVHASLLPRWRGAAPIQRAIMAGDKETGVAIMQMEAGLDTGPVGLVEKIAITADMNAGELHDRLARAGADALGRALAALSRGTLAFTPQPEDGITYAKKITNDEARIDWSQSAQHVHDHVRGLSPFPGAFCMIAGAKGSERMKILRTARETGSGAPGTVLDDRLLIACGDGAVRLVEVQRAGSKPMKADDLLHGFAVPAGTLLS